MLPDEAAVEETFVNKDAQATLKLGHARAVALLVPALAGLPVAEYAANLVKKTVVGAGHAEKDQVGAMVRFLLPRPPPTRRMLRTRSPSPSPMRATVRRGCAATHAAAAGRAPAGSPGRWRGGDRYRTQNFGFVRFYKLIKVILAHRSG